MGRTNNPPSLYLYFTELEEELNRYKRAVLGGTTGVSSGMSGVSNVPGVTGTMASSAMTGYSSAISSSLPNGGAHMGVGSTGVTYSSSASNAQVPGTGLTSISALVPNSIGGISSSMSSHAITAAAASAAYGHAGAGHTSAVDKLLSGTSGIAGIPPLPVNIHTMKSMPSALSQVNYHNSSNPQNMNKQQQATATISIIKYSSAFSHSVVLTHQLPSTHTSNHFVFSICTNPT